MVYLTTFTPDGEVEPDKICGMCKKILPSKSFNSRRGYRNDIHGIIRNTSCLKCEGHRSKPRESKVDSHTIQTIDSINHELASLKDSMDDVLKTNERLQQIVNNLLIQNMNRDIRIDKLENQLVKINVSKK